MAPTIDDHAKRVTARYSSEAVAYRELWAPVLFEPAMRLLAQIESKKAKRVLDVGTGVGSFLPALGERFPDATLIGVDRSAGMIRLAPAAMPRAVMDARALAIRTAQLDVAIFAFVLFHLDGPIDGLNEAHRVLGNAGTIGTVTWGGEFESTATRVWDAELEEAGAPLLDT